MAKAMGIDPSTKRYVPFDIVDRRFTRNFLDLVIRPLEEQGIDFWWLDWQQWGTTTITGVTPTWWLNYVFFTSMERRKTTRPILFHRWGGLGNHRYQVGFSGDVVSAWESLAFQPTFTATAANVGFGYWSHDIGGHMGGAPTPEMYTRWIQFGAFSPVLRTHTTKDPNSERRIWGYPLDNFLVMRDAFVLRYSLIPYVYTQARRTYDTGISLCRPMYYDWPESPEAYRFPGEYMFGDDILVAPIATPVADSSLLAAKDVWLPEGKWMEWWTGSALTGPAIVTRSFALYEIPAYVRAGSVIPMQQKTNRANARPLDPLILTIFAGDSGSTSVYEDQGNSLGYLRGECAWTDVRHTRRTDGTRRVDIAPVRGGFPRMLARRGYEVRLRGVLPPARVTCNGTVLPYTTAKKQGWWYDGETLTLTIATPVRPVRERTVLEVVPAGRGESGASLTSGFMGAQARLRRVMGMINKHWPREWSPDRLVRAVQTGNRIGRHPETSREELAAFWQSVTAFRDTLPALRIPDSTRAIVGRHLEGIHGPR
jgi:alpha-glucosidase